jgi:hypothetical protein
MKIRARAIATSLIVNERGELDLDVKGSKSIEIGNIVLENDLPGYDDKILG